METRHPTAFVLNILAEDRPGIVAAVAGAIVARGGNIDACSQTVVSRYFTQIMVVSFPQPVSAGQIREEIIQSGQGELGLQVQVTPYSAPAPDSTGSEGDNFVITAFGNDREGIVLRFSQFLADKGINISDLYAHSEGDQFVLVGQVRVPRHWDIQMLKADLEHLADQIGHTVRIQHENVFVATNQLRLPRTTGLP